MAERTRTTMPQPVADEHAPLPVDDTLHVCGGCGAAEFGQFPECAHGKAPHARSPHPDAPADRYPLPEWVAHNLTHHTDINRDHADRHRHHLPEDHPSYLEPPPPPPPARPVRR